MRRPLLPIVAAAVAASTLLAACSGSGTQSALPASGSRDVASGRALPASGRALPASGRALPASGRALPANPHVQRNASIPVVPDVNAASVPGYTPADLRAAYGLGALPAGTAATTWWSPHVVIVDAFDDPTAESDLAVYRSRFGLPPCTSANGCFHKVNQLLETRRYPAPNQAWAEEISLDLAMASVACPQCRLTLIEANAATAENLALAAGEAAVLFPSAISNSYGFAESAQATSGLEAFYVHPGVAVVASAGDGGFVQFPAASPHVIAVGGTTLVPASSTTRGWSETTWKQTGAGCSAYSPAAWWQSTSCGTRRAVPDVSFAADLNPGVAIYNSQDGGWETLGGTSAGAPFIAGLFAAKRDFGWSTEGAQTIYARASLLNHVDTSADVADTTLGSPNGLGAF